MTTLICPCCGENYHVDVEVQTGRKVFCGKCQRKHIYYNYALVPFAIELAPKGNDRRISCPFCQRHFLIEIFSIGEYCCTGCGTPFYVPRKPEVYAPGVEASAAIVPPPAPPAGLEPVDVEKLPAEAYTGFSTEPLMEVPLKLPTEEVTAEEKKSVEAEIEKSEMSEREKVTSAVTVRLPDESVKATPSAYPDIFSGKGAVEPEKTPVPTINVKQKSGMNPLSLLDKLKKF